ncbi:FKBP-type peptidyl-prolyl cis-trans isomerase [Caldimonas tepidiphila]|uniref:FKBP-type peptidyl-prolyl cis-trans isomerase n=1 Tax=Caldimonas tepidiphila TaxID=2315841 RepID=UPI000E5AD46B|nr:FKBP-type peptidyl-prolyl cis-trans isomerase [Caldimonas tepidiphila]
MKKSFAVPLALAVLGCATAFAAGAPGAATTATTTTTATATATATETLPSGVVVEHLKTGQGASPSATDVVRVHYRGTLENGTEFDSSFKRNEPATFPLNRVIPCWTQGVQKMKVGGKARLTCPSDTAYGPRGAGGLIPPNAKLTFEVELLDIRK